MFTIDCKKKNKAEKGYVRMVIEEGQTPTVEMQLVNGNLWMSKTEIAQFFNCFPAKIEMNLRSIFKNGLLREENVCFTDRYMYKGKERQCDYFNLEILMFLTYRIATVESQIFRQFVHSALRAYLQRHEAEKCNRLIWQFRQNMDFWQN